MNVIELDYEWHSKTWLGNRIEHFSDIVRYTPPCNNDEVQAPHIYKVEEYLNGIMEWA